MLSCSLIYFLILNLFKKKYNFFLYFSIFYYLIHFYSPVNNLISKVGFLRAFNDTKEISLIFIILVLLFVIIIHINIKIFAKLIERSFIFIFLINLIYHQYPNINFIYQNFLKTQNYNSLNNHHFYFDILKLNELKKLQKKNVYYIILDGMMPLDLAKKHNLIKNLSNELTKLKEANLFYINKSFSSYNFTHTTIDSIWNLDYFKKETSLDIDFQGYPKSQYRSIDTNFQTQLEYFLQKIDVNFYWLDNMMFSCKDSQNSGWYEKQVHWKCLDSSEYSKLIHLASTRFRTTPINDFITKFFTKSDIININERTKGQLNLSTFTDKYFEKIKNKNPYFVFIHNMAPHWPFSLNKNCSRREYKVWAQTQYQYNGYKSSYLCMLNEIEKFMDYINKFDPKALVVIQSDHGWVIREDDIRMNKNDVYDRARIFNAIKAPNDCNLINNIPKNNINTIRFVLNCAYKQKLKYREIIHYEKFWGKEYLHIKEKKVLMHNFN